MVVLFFAIAGLGLRVTESGLGAGPVLPYANGLGLR